MNDELRASDADRERGAHELREHFAAGRISADELTERLERVYAATTVSELASPRADLPPLPVPASVHQAELRARRSQLQRQLLQQAGGSLGIFAVCVAIWAASGAHAQFWPAWVLIVPLLLVVRNGWRLYGPAPDLDLVEAELARRARRHGGRHGHRRRLQG